MPIPPRVSAVALRAADLARSTAFYGEAVLSIHVASDDEVDAALDAAVRAGGVMVKEAAPTPLGGSYGFFADPDGHVWEIIHHPRSTGSGPTGGPRSPRPGPDDPVDQRNAARPFHRPAAGQGPDRDGRQASTPAMLITRPSR